jgi:hypothetical protein
MDREPNINANRSLAAMVSSDARAASSGTATFEVEQMKKFGFKAKRTLVLDDRDQWVSFMKKGGRSSLKQEEDSKRFAYSSLTEMRPVKEKEMVLHISDDTHSGKGRDKHVAFQSRQDRERFVYHIHNYRTQQTGRGLQNLSLHHSGNRRPTISVDDRGNRTSAAGSATGMGGNGGRGGAGAGAGGRGAVQRWGSERSTAAAAAAFASERGGGGGVLAGAVGDGLQRSGGGAGGRLDERVLNLVNGEVIYEEADDTSKRAPYVLTSPRPHVLSTSSLLPHRGLATAHYVSASLRLCVFASLRLYTRCRVDTGDNCLCVWVSVCVCLDKSLVRFF